MQSPTAKLQQGKGKSDSLVRQFADVEHILLKLSGSRGLLDRSPADECLHVLGHLAEHDVHRSG